MYPWVANPCGAFQSQEKTPQLIAELKPDSSFQGPNKPVHVPVWALVSSFFLSAFLFLSAFFAIFSPFPLLFLQFKKGRMWACLAVATNSAIVFIAGGSLSLFFYFVFCVTLSMTLAELLRKKVAIEKAVGWTLFAMTLCGAGFVLGDSIIRHASPLNELRTQVLTFVDTLGQAMSNNGALLDQADLDDWKKSLTIEFPSAIAILSLIFVWVNLVLLLKVNPNRVRESLGLDSSFLKNWKTPEILVWPTIVAGLFLIVEAGIVSDIAINVFRFLMAVYVIQGLSIVSFFFDVWRIQGFFRGIGFFLVLFFLMPLILCLGFFDLWFDFRGKFRQS
jgi:hypothetical protein